MFENIDTIIERFMDDQRVLDFFRMIINHATTASLQITLNRFNTIYSIHFLQSCEESKIEFISIILSIIFIQIR